MFTLALRRDGIGYLALGGLPPVQHGDRWASTPIVVSKIGTDYQYAYYSIIPDRLQYNGSAPSQSYMYFVDSGSTLSYFPASIAEEVNKLFDPPATKIDNSYYVECNATPPQFGIAIGGVAFSVSYIRDYYDMEST
jgi:hypothetical protein